MSKKHGTGLRIVLYAGLALLAAWMSGNNPTLTTV
jgi:hypothetical protein